MSTTSDIAADEQRLAELEARKDEVWQEMTRVREEADTRIEVLRTEWVELYDSKELRRLRREADSRKYAEERAQGIIRCGYCGNTKDNPGTMSDDSYSTFKCPWPGHYR